MFAKINHVAIVSEKYALITKFYEAAFGMYQSKTSPKSALTVGDGYVGLNINPRKAGRPAGLDHFGIEVEDVETAFDRMRTKYPDRRLGAAALDAAVRRHHRQRSRRQRVRHLAEGHEEPPRRLCAEHRRAAAALHHACGDAHHASGRDGAVLCPTCSSSPSRTRAPAIPTIISATARSR